MKMIILKDLKPKDITYQKELLIIITLNINIRIYVCLNNFIKNQRDTIKIFSKKFNSIINNGKLSRSVS